MYEYRKSIVICADDYGLSTGVCDAIETLIEKGRLSATGAMTGMPAWRRRAEGLRALARAHPADIGLHFTLTGQRPLSPARGLARDGRLPEIGALALRALAGVLPRPAIRDELRAQLDAFEEEWDAPPDFLDGHQHAHALPGIRDIVIAELSARYAGRLPWLRNCSEPAARARRRGIGFRKAIIVGTLGAGTAQAAAKAGIVSNDSFRGLYGFMPEPPYREVFRAALAGPGERILVHCHPGVVDEELRALDPLLEPREWELAYLGSDACGEDMAAAGVQPARFAETGERSVVRG
ncbi:YdjC family protein [Ancylobacter novellus DSM 506]|uniref:YdjC family protein n=1 Tax=Ancylobacter novellus (strain ATCC 8093 / DSM 506 / JCM 20403 / CCM 1077 / IAM 12100 / NBRC 12443 / NCIMB 10456) TaxID=639283 RepID=D7A3N1_ANCN5|nr:ChbG/HpnK family deacetylase [Ancylobacter novellus]ADH91658.1 YdjC family protein [Ancylobacter novellus DSM 506]